jgi:hypothetical protein
MAMRTPGIEFTELVKQKGRSPQEIALFVGA